jgi:hypothetical protein
MHPLGERLALNRAALRARLACSAWTYQLQRATGAFSLVADLLGQLVLRGVVDGLGEHPGCQSFDVQIRHRDVRETVNQGPGQLVRVIPPLVGDVRTQVRDAKLSLARARAVPALPGNRPPGAARRRSRGLGVLWHWHRLTRGQRHQRGQPQVDADWRERAFARRRHESEESPASYGV